MLKKIILLGSFLVLFELNLIGSDFKFDRSSSFDSDSDVDHTIQGDPAFGTLLKLWSSTAVTTACYLADAPSACTTCGAITTGWYAVQFYRELVTEDSIPELGNTRKLKQD